MSYRAIRNLAIASVLLSACAQTNPFSRLRAYPEPEGLRSPPELPPALATERLRSGCEELRLSTDEWMTDGALIRLIRCDGNVAGEVWIRTSWRVARFPDEARAHSSVRGCARAADGDVDCFVRTHAGSEAGWRRLLALADSVDAWTLAPQVKCAGDVCLVVADGGDVTVETLQAGRYRRQTYDAPQAYNYADNWKAARLRDAVDSLANHWADRAP